jgi:hypothetical protein
MTFRWTQVEFQSRLPPLNVRPRQVASSIAGAIDVAGQEVFMEASRTGVRGERWVTFAAVLFLVVGTFNVIDGIALIVDDNYFRADELLFGDLTLWGWLAIIMGAGQILVGFGIFSGSVLAQVVGVFWAGFNAILHLMAIGAYPAWSIIIMAIDGLVIYALIMYGRAFNEA